LLIYFFFVPSLSSCPPLVFIREKEATLPLSLHGADVGWPGGRPQGWSVLFFCLVVGQGVGLISFWVSRGGGQEREREVLQGRKNLLPLPVTRPGEK